MSDHFLNNFAPPVAPLSPEQIENKEFTSSLKGFDHREVQEFLRMVAHAYGNALQDVMRLELILDDAKQEAVSVDERARHAEIELQEAQRLRQEAAEELEAAQQLREQVVRQQQEAEAIVAHAQETTAAGFQDPYGVAGQQVAEILRAADAVSNSMRKESEDIVSVSKLSAEKLLADAKQHSEEIAEAARVAAEQEAARMEEAKRLRAQLMSSMQTVEQQLQSVMSAAMSELSAPAAADNNSYEAE